MRIYAEPEKSQSLKDTKLFPVRSYIILYQLHMIRHAFSKKNRALLAELVRTDFKLRYQGSVLGYAWTLLRPLLLFLILYYRLPYYLTVPSPGRSTRSLVVIFEALTTIFCLVTLSTPTSLTSLIKSITLSLSAVDGFIVT